MVPTVFHVTHWKAGSQWIRAVLEEAAPERIVPPQPGQAHVFHAAIVPGGIYTPVYAGEEQFRTAVPASVEQRTFVVVRDPRDTLVSYYYSLLYSHGDDWETVAETRGILQQVDKSDGLAILLRNELWDVINIQMTWLNAGAHRIFYYEDLLRDEFVGFQRLFEFCAIDISARRLHEIVAKHSFERVAGRKPGVADPKSHLRNGQAGDWRQHFPDRLLRLYRTLYGHATVRLGYAKPGKGAW